MIDPRVIPALAGVLRWARRQRNLPPEVLTMIELVDEALQFPIEPSDPPDELEEAVRAYYEGEDLRSR